MVAYVRTHSKSTRSARTLLLVIASHVNPDTGWAWPSLDTLAEETTLTRRRVIQQLLASFGDVGWEPTAIPVWRASDAPAVWRQD
jgi:Helix-turn-helix domain